MTTNAISELETRLDAALGEVYNEYPNQGEAISDYIRAQAIEIDNLRARIDDVSSMLAQSDKRNYILRLALLFIANQDNLTFAECSVAEAIIGRAKEALALTDATPSEPRRPE